MLVALVCLGALAWAAPAAAAAFDDTLVPPDGAREGSALASGTEVRRVPAPVRPPVGSCPPGSATSATATADAGSAGGFGPSAEVVAPRPGVAVHDALVPPPRPATGGAPAPAGLRCIRLPVTARMPAELGDRPEHEPSSCAAECPQAVRAAARAAYARALDVPAPPRPWTGGPTPCTPPDPTGGPGCVTSATRHGMAVLEEVFGPLAEGPVVRRASCWDRHAWNPASDHPRGRACDLFPGVAGTFGDERQIAAGWRVANYLRANAKALAVSYVIWQGRFWSPTTADRDGWGEPYTGGGVYDPADATGGHYDHVHVSFAQ